MDTCLCLCVCVSACAHQRAKLKSQVKVKETVAAGLILKVHFQTITVNQSNSQDTTLLTSVC